MLRNIYCRGETVRIFFDLDGPILNVSEKYYRVYADLLTGEGYKVLSKTEYWKCKREKIQAQEILKYTDAETIVQKYQQKRKEVIESDKYLAYDRTQDGARETLEALANDHELVMVTLRSLAPQLYKELEWLDLKKYFRQVLTSGEELSPRWEIKYRLITEFLAGKEVKSGFLVGDTETDIIAGQKLGLITVAVHNGIRCCKLLKEADPTYLISSLKEILKIDLFSSRVVDKD